MRLSVGELRCGIRMLVKNPGFTVTALLVLAVGSRANSAGFSALNAVVLRPSPYCDPGPSSKSPPCDVPAQTLELLNQSLKCISDPGIPYEERMSPLRAIADANPNDFSIQRFYQDAFRRHFFLADEYDRALALYRRSPDSLISRYFEARLLLKVEPERCSKTLENLMAGDSAFVWPHLDLIELESLPGRRDPKKIEPHMKAFLDNCSGNPEALGYFQWIEDRSLLGKGAVAGRRSLEKRDTPLDLPLWANLWSVESRAGVENDELKRRVRADLNRIESWRPWRLCPELLRVYRQASEILDDAGILNGLEARVAKMDPQSSLMQGLVQMRWARENPLPDRSAPPEQLRAYRLKRAQAEAEWRGKWPNSPQLANGFWQQSVRRSHEGEANPQELEEIADRMLQFHSQAPDVVVSWPPFEVLLAEMYVRNSIRLDQVLQLLDAGMQAIEKQEKYRLFRDLVPPELSGRLLDNRSLTFQRIMDVRIDYLLTVNRTSEARALIDQELAKTTPQGSRVRAPGENPHRRNELVRKLGRVAEKENRVGEALAHYQASLSGLSPQAINNPRDLGMAAIKTYYLAHGGTEETWLEWARTATEASPERSPRPSLQFTQQVPRFAIKDLSGRLWRLEDLKGKGTFINLWATWCGPCRAEHPEIQKLHDRLKNSTNMQILTLSVDTDPALVAAYMKEKGYTFPVIQSPVLANKLFPYAGLPSNVIVNADCMRTGLYPFGGGESGLQRTLDDLARAAKPVQ